MKHIKELRQFAKSLGLETEVEHRRNTHFGIRLTHANGQSTTLIVGSSPSDHRAALNNRAFIKRFTRQQTME